MVEEESHLPGTESPVKIKSGASVKDLGDALEIGAGELIKTLMQAGRDGHHHAIPFR